MGYHVDYDMVAIGLQVSRSSGRMTFERATEAMMTMNKIDIATIEAARAGAKADE